MNRRSTYARQASRRYRKNSKRMAQLERLSTMSRILLPSQPELTMLRSMRKDFLWYAANSVLGPALAQLLLQGLRL